MENKEPIAEIINNIYRISSNALKDLLRIIQIESIPKNEIFINKNRLNEYEYIILDGVCRSFLISPEGDDITVSFFQDRSILTPNVARTLNGFSSLNFQALTELNIGKFKANGLINLIKKYPELRSFANAVLQNELRLKVHKEISNASLSAKERLIEFRKTYKSLESIIPHPYIASYLGITNISLSRLRSDLANA